jgi:TrmH family RNA methyltransferase
MAGNLHSLIRDLQRRKARERRGLVVAEGIRLVADALEGAAGIVAILAADDAARGPAAPMLAAAAAQGIETVVVPRREFDRLADTETPSGVLAVVAWRPLALEALRVDGPGIVLVLDAVQDPGNVGTMIRTAHALGAAATVALDGTADVRSPKVLRAAMGAIFRHPVVAAGAADFASFASRSDFAVWAAVPGGEPLSGGDRVPARLALAIGNEGAGVRGELLALAQRRVTIPMRAGAESLNAAVAAGILLYEATHARR